MDYHVFQTKKEFFSECDVVVNSLPGTDETTHFCNEDAFRWMATSELEADLEAAEAAQEGAGSTPGAAGVVGAGAGAVLNTSASPEELQRDPWAQGPLRRKIFISVGRGKTVDEAALAKY